MRKVNLIDLNKNIIENVYIKNIYNFSILHNLEFINLELFYDDLGDFKGIIIDDKNKEIIFELLNHEDIINTFPVTLKQYRAIEDNIEVKISKVAFSKGTGNSSKNSYSTSLYIPIKWLHELGINKENNKFSMEFNGEEIVIKSINQR